LAPGAISPSPRIFSAAAAGNPAVVRGHFATDLPDRAFSAFCATKKLQKIRVFTSQEPNYRFTIPIDRVDFAHGEIAMWDNTVLTSEATHSDSCHRRQVSGKFRRGNHFTAWRGDLVRSTHNGNTASNAKAELKSRYY
jgi:hypothetical protein